MSAASTAREPTWLDKREPGSRCAIIAEVAQAHDGSLGMAHAFIDAAANAGVDAIKFQTHIAAAESTAAEPWRTRFSPQDESRIDYWRRMEFSPEQWAGLRAHAERCGLDFLSSAFSPDAVDLLERVGVAGWKIASGEINNRPLFDAIAGSGLPVLLSTGMSPLSEVDEAVGWVRASGAALAVMQCSSVYPCPPEQLGLNVLAVLRERYGAAVGLSDHSATTHAGVAAAALGVEVLEVHLTLSREMFGPDVAASLTPAELQCLVEGVRFVETARVHPVDKDRLDDDVAALRSVFMKSVVAAVDLPAGRVLRVEDLAVKKPGTGIPARHIARLIGRRLRRDLPCDAALDFDDLEAE
jgi:N-acetylneuraminate synthase